MRFLILIGLFLSAPMASHARDTRLPPSVPPEAARVLRGLPSASIILPIQQQSWMQRDQVLCLALAIYHEARDAERDQTAVAHVIFNRMKQNGSSVCATVWADGGSQFQWVRHPNIIPREIASWRLVQASAAKLLNHPTADVTHGATNFYNKTLSSPDWANQGHVTMQLRHTYIRMRMD